MDTVECDSKVNCLLDNDAICTKLSVKSNPINRVTSHVNKYVWNLYKCNKISKICYLLRCSKGVTSRFYGLLKISKPSVPLPPVVLFVNSPTYYLSKFLSRIL